DRPAPAAAGPVQLSGRPPRRPAPAPGCPDLLHHRDHLRRAGDPDPPDHLRPDRHRPGPRRPQQARAAVEGRAGCRHRRHGPRLPARCDRPEQQL
ncbi:MAG: hypothetical protein AVDCRST_MAG41-3053, partial [uncultured Corynebacteriales bacterium]